MSATRVQAGGLRGWFTSNVSGSGRLRQYENTKIVKFRHHFSSRPHKDDSGVTHFRKRGMDAWQTVETKSDRTGYSLWHIRVAVGSVAVAGGALFVWSRVETVPYTNRRHVIFLSKAQEKALGEQGYEQAGASLPVINCWIAFRQGDTATCLFFLKDAFDNCWIVISDGAGNTCSFPPKDFPRVLARNSL